MSGRPGSTFGSEQRFRQHGPMLLGSVRTAAAAQPADAKHAGHGAPAPSLVVSGNHLSAAAAPAHGGGAGVQPRGMARIMPTADEIRARAAARPASSVSRQRPAVPSSAPARRCVPRAAAATAASTARMRARARGPHALTGCLFRMPPTRALPARPARRPTTSGGGSALRATRSTGSTPRGAVPAPGLSSARTQPGLHARTPAHAPAVSPYAANPRPGAGTAGASAARIARSRSVDALRRSTALMRVGGAAAAHAAPAAYRTELEVDVPSVSEPSGSSRAVHVPALHRAPHEADAERRGSQEHRLR